MIEADLILSLFKKLFFIHSDYNVENYNRKFDCRLDISIKHYSLYARTSIIKLP